MQHGREQSIRIIAMVACSMVAPFAVNLLNTLVVTLCAKGCPVNDISSVLQASQKAAGFETTKPLSYFGIASAKKPAASMKGIGEAA